MCVAAVWRAVHGYACQILFGYAYRERTISRGGPNLPLDVHVLRLLVVSAYLPGAVQNMLTRWVLALLSGFLNFRSDAPKYRFLGEGM